jgi:hypothetical protein
MGYKNNLYFFLISNLLVCPVAGQKIPKKILPGLAI